MRRPRHVALLPLVACAVPWSVLGQGVPRDRLAAARAELRALKLDSAALLIRQALDTAARASREERIEAWLLLGVVQFYQADDSGTAAAFREALVLEPMLEARGLARYDSALVAVFEAQRTVAAAIGAPVARPGGAVLDCTRSCPGDVALPRLIALPELEGQPPDLFDVEHHREGALTFRLLVDAEGRVAPGSVRVVRSTFRLKELERAVLLALERTRFTPARGKGGLPLPVVVEGRLRFWNGSLAADVPVRPD